MIELIIGNSYSQIKGFNPSQFKQLQQDLSYVVNPNASYYTGGFTRRKSLLDKKGFFPSGLLHRLPPLAMKVTDKRLKPLISSAIQFFPSAYAWQLDAVNRAVVANRGIISAPTGTGKSLAMAMLISRLNVHTLVIVPSLEICHQLRATFKRLGLANVMVYNIDSKALNNLTGFDCLIIDEGHHVAAKTYHKLNKTAWKDIYYRFFFTATPYRNQSEEMLLFEAIAGMSIYELTIEDAISEGYIVPIEAYYYDVTHTDPKDAYTWSEVYSKMVVNNEFRNMKIAELLEKLSKNYVHTLCLVKEVAHGKKLSELTGIPFVHGQDEESRQYIQEFNSGKIHSLIGTTGILGEGIDTKPAEYIVIAGLGKAKSAFMQQIGRAVRNYPGKESAKIILFKDSGHKFCLKHFKAQVKILKEIGVKCLKL